MSDTIRLVLGITVLIGGLVAYGHFTFPILGIDYDTASPEAAKIAGRGWLANWLIALTGFCAFLVLGPIPLALLFLAIATGAWLELVRHYPGAP